MLKRVLILLLLFVGVGCFSLAQAQVGEENIKVAISTNDFKSIQHKEITISATSDWQIFDEDRKEILAKLKPMQEVKIVLKSGFFDIYYNGRLVSYMLCGPLTITTTQNGLLKVVGLERLHREALYRGKITLEKVKSRVDYFYIINTLGLQEYLYAVVPNEMPVFFGLEALKAQAVAARNYALRPRSLSANSQYMVTDSVESQVYFGANTEVGISNKAVDETKNIVALYDGKLILALYHSTSGGMTENYENAFNRPGTKIFPANPVPYLKAVSDVNGKSYLSTEEEVLNFYKTYPKSYENGSKFYRWQRTWSREELEQILNVTLKRYSNSGYVDKMLPFPDELGQLKELKVIQRGKSGKLVQLSIIGDKNVYLVKKELVIRRVLLKNDISLPSANVAFESQYNEKGELVSITAYGGGFGHGVGMSQYGAGYMATKLGKTFDEILKHYYTNIKLATIPVNIETDKKSEIMQQFYVHNQSAKLKVENLKSSDDITIKLNNIDNIKLRPANTKVTTYILTPYIKDGMNTITYKNSGSSLKNNLRLYIEFSQKEEQ